MDAQPADVLQRFTRGTSLLKAILFKVVYLEVLLYLRVRKIYI